MTNLKDLKVAILTKNGFELSELSPKQAMEEAGITVHIVFPQAREVRCSG